MPKLILVSTVCLTCTGRQATAKQSCRQHHPNLSYCLLSWTDCNRQSAHVSQVPAHHTASLMWCIAQFERPCSTEKLVPALPSDGGWASVVSLAACMASSEPHAKSCPGGKVCPQMLCGTLQACQPYIAATPMLCHCTVALGTFTGPACICSHTCHVAASTGQCAAIRCSVVDQTASSEMARASSAALPQ